MVSLGAVVIDVSGGIVSGVGGADGGDGGGSVIGDCGLQPAPARVSRIKHRMNSVVGLLVILIGQ